MVGTTVIVKIAAFFYKLPLGSMKLLGDEGFAHFMVAYNIYSFFLTLSTMLLTRRSFFNSSSIFRQAWRTVVWSFLLKP